MIEHAEPEWPEGMKLSHDDFNQVMWALWGSAGRGELSSSSDVDILVWAPAQGPLFTPPAIAKWETPRPIDLLRVEADPYTRALKSGIDLYAIYSTKSLKGDPGLIEKFKLVQLKLYDDEFLRAREALHIILCNSSFGVISPPNTPINIKTIPGGARAWAALAIAHVFLHPEALSSTTENIWQDIADITGSKLDDLTKARHRVSELRNMNDAPHSLSELMQLSNLWHDVASKYLDKNIEWIQSNINAQVDLLEKAIQICLGNSVAVPHPNGYNNSVDSFLRAMICSDANKLDEMASSESDWWTIAAITSNPHTQTGTLTKLAFPSWEFDFPAWRLPRGRIVAHPNTSIQTLINLANTDSKMVGTFPYMAKKALELKRNR